MEFSELIAELEKVYALSPRQRRKQYGAERIGLLLHELATKLEVQLTKREQEQRELVKRLFG